METQPEVYNDEFDEIDLDMQLYILDRLINKRIPDYLENRGFFDLFLNTNARVEYCLNLCIDDEAKRVYLNGLIDKYFSLISEADDRFFLIMHDITHFEDYYYKSIGNNLEKIKAIDFADNFIKDIEYSDKNLLKYSCDAVFVEDNKVKDYYINLMSAHFSLKYVKRILMKPSIIPKKEALDFENFVINNPKGTEKIVMLHKLGVLDYLKEKEPFNTTTNALASVVSTMTGLKQQSVYPMLQTIFNPENNQKNNPLNSLKTSQKVEQTLTSIGFKIE
jgi:hypothetical protein